MNKPNATNATKKEIPCVKVNSFKVISANVLQSGAVAFNMELNGVTIYGCFVCESANGDFISYPQRKGNDGKYYSIVWVKLSKEDSDAIIREVENMINS